MAEIVPLTGATISSETVEELETEMQEAGDGALVGLAVVKLYTGFRYSVEIVGQARAVPTFTRGALHVLDDKLAAMIREALEAPA